MSRGVFLLALAVGGLLVALVVWRGEQSDLRPSGSSPGQATPEAKVSAAVAGDVDALTQSRSEVLTTSARAESPWAPEVIARAPQDSFGMPREQRPFLHKMLLMMTSRQELLSGRMSPYRLDVDRLVADLPEPYATPARERIEELRALVGDHVKSTAALEAEHWRDRFEAYHEAIEAGRFVVVDNRDVDENGARSKVEQARESLQLGELNRDYVYLLTSGKPAEGGEMGRFSAIIYVTRVDAPHVFKTLSEIDRVVEIAQNAIRDRLGIPR